MRVRRLAVVVQVSARKARQSRAAWLARNWRVCCLIDATSCSIVAHRWCA